MGKGWSVTILSVCGVFSLWCAAFLWILSSVCLNGGIGEGTCSALFDASPAVHDRIAAFLSAGIIFFVIAILHGKSRALSLTANDLLQLEEQSPQVPEQLKEQASSGR